MWLTETLAIMNNHAQLSRPAFYCLNAVGAGEKGVSLFLKMVLEQNKTHSMWYKGSGSFSG